MIFVDADACNVTQMEMYVDTMIPTLTGINPTLLAIRNSYFQINQRAIASITTNGFFVYGWNMGTPVNPYVTISQEAIIDLVGFNICARVVITVGLFAGQNNQGDSAVAVQLIMVPHF